MNYNMYAGAFLGTVFVVMTLSMTSGAIFHTEEPEQEAFAIIVDESAATAAAPEEEEALGAIAPLLASADVGAGENAFRKCSACHNDEPGGANKVGPNLWGIIMSPAGSVDGFSYSAAMQAYAAEGNVWDFEALNRFIAAPRDYIDGTSMGFAGISRESERADLIAYLRTTADNPVDLPDPNAAPVEDASMETEEVIDAAPEAQEEPVADEVPAEPATDATPEAMEGDAADAPVVDEVPAEEAVIEDPEAEPAAEETETPAE